MKWTVSDVIAITAIIASAIGPVINSIFNYFKTINLEELETQKQEMEQQRQNYKDFTDNFRKIFDKYTRQTMHELSSSGPFSPTQKELEAQVLMYADNNLAEKIKLFNEIDSHYIYNKVPDEFLEVLRAFNVQWQTQLPKLNLKHNK